MYSLSYLPTSSLLRRPATFIKRICKQRAVELLAHQSERETCS
jgi:hypothetical protein